MNGNNGNANGAIVTIGFKPDVLVYYFLNNGNVKVTGFWKKEFKSMFVMSAGSDGVSYRKFASGGGSTYHRAALSEVNDTGFKLYGGYTAGTGTYWACKFE